MEEECMHPYDHTVYVAYLQISDYVVILDTPESLCAESDK